MRLGLLTPIVIRNPAGHNAWEADASVHDLVVIARAADEAGYEHLTASEHVGIPASEQDRRGVVYYDAATTLAYLAAHTSSIRLLTHCAVLPYTHPLQLVKRFSTLDRLSGGRLILGVGVGSLREEFELLGVDFDGRGPRADDAIRAIRAAWGDPEPAYHGTYHRFAGFRVEPTAVQERVPIWVGGRTERSLQRAVALGDGWVPFGLEPDEVRALLARTTVRRGFEVVLRPGHQLLDPAGDPAGTVATVEALREAGATVVLARVRSGSVDEHVEQLRALRELTRDR